MQRIYFIWNKLIFEGEFKNSKKNGKAKEFDIYNVGKISFEGTYLNGKRFGKGKEYNRGNLWFEGTYLNGKRNGRGKEYDFYHSTFEGEFLNGYKIEGKRYDKNGKLEFVLERNGKGKFFMKLEI